MTNEEVYQLIPRRRQYRELPPLMSKAEIARFFPQSTDWNDFRV
ncbi:MAG: hypothetical protein VB100_09005 [Angelakisella sp.]|nr:hypothetical protein [Angelakisella sp.]